MGFTQLEVFVRSVGNRVDFDVVQEMANLKSCELYIGPGFVCWTVPG